MTRRSRTSTRYLGRITPTQLNQAATRSQTSTRYLAGPTLNGYPVGYLAPGEPIPAAVLAEIAECEARGAAQRAAEAEALAADFDAQVEAKMRRLDAEARLTGTTWMGTHAR